MGEVAAAQSFQVRPVRQLPGSPQERQQLSFFPGARRGATPQESSAPAPPPHLSRRCRTTTRRRRSSCSGEKPEKEGDTPAPSLAPLNNRMAPPPAGWLSSQQQGAHRRCPRKVLRGAAVSAEPPLRLARRGASRPAPTEPGAPHAPPYIGAVGPRLPGPARSAPRRAHWLRCRPPRPDPARRAGKGGGAGGYANNE